MASGERPELRLGLVLYGGVSLAVYIYGVVVEVQRLLRASAEYEAAGSGDEVSAGYGEALLLGGLSRADVDIVAGTSAGGINGILLAKALASGGDVEKVRRLWIEGGDVAALLRSLDQRAPLSLLSTEAMETQLASGFGELDEGGGPVAAGALDLFVSATHLRGSPHRFEDSLHAPIDTLTHRYVFQRKLRPRQKPPRNDFAPVVDPEGKQGPNARLVNLARATSAFPVAFEPVELRRSEELLGPRDEESAWFADGGILNNKPFTEALQAIFTRSSDRPVRRWLLSVDPDPKAVDLGPAPGPEPAFDQVALSAVSGIPRYQSIAHDLEALEEHNEAVRRIGEAILGLERDLKGAAPPPAAGASGAFGELQRQIWAEEVADRLIAAAAPKTPASFDPEATRHAFTEAALATLPPDRADLAFQMRRAYYSIKLIALAVGGRDDGDGDSSLDPARIALWDGFELASTTLWEQLSEDDLVLGEEDPEHPGESPADQAYRLGRARIEAALEAFDTQAKAVDRAVATAVRGVWLELPLRVEPGPGESALNEVSLAAVVDGFAPRDAFMLSVEAGGLRHLDHVDHAQISPATATATGVDAAAKLAGDTAGHFGGFLDRRWRENDLLWGRLDAAEILVGAMMVGTREDERAAVVEAVQRQILEAEGQTDALAAPEGWREYLKAHAIGTDDISKLPKQRIEGLEARAGFVLRRMLHRAALDAETGPGGPGGKMRRRVLGTADDVLKWGECLGWPWVRKRLKRARGSEPSS